MKDIEFLNKVKSIPENLSNDLNELKANKHTHTNLDVLNSITSEKILQWDAMSGEPTPDIDGEVTPSSHTHKNLKILDQIGPVELSNIKKISTIESSVNNKADTNHNHDGRYVQIALGKQLSTEDFTTEYKNKLDKLQASSDFDGSYNSLTDLPDLSQYAKESSIDQLVDAKVTNKMPNLKEYVKTDTYTEGLRLKADKEHVHTQYRRVDDSYSQIQVQEQLALKANLEHNHDDKYVKLEPGKQLSEENFTNLYKKKIDQIMSGQVPGIPEGGSGDSSNEPINASQIVEDTSHRFITDEERSLWNRKADPSYIDEKIPEIKTATIEAINLELKNKYVSVVPGKQLSTEDFTTEFKGKLETLRNYEHPATHSSDMIMVGDQTLTDVLKNGTEGSTPETSNNGMIGLVLDHNSERVPGLSLGTDTPDTSANDGTAIKLEKRIGTIAEFKIPNEQIRLGKYAIALRIKVDNTTIETPIVAVTISKETIGGRRDELRELSFVGNNFESTSAYSWMTAWFNYAMPKMEGDNFIVTVNLLNSAVTAYLDYVIINPIMTAQYSLI